MNFYKRKIQFWGTSSDRTNKEEIQGHTTNHVLTIVKITSSL